jgi:hypothetical protein
VSGFSRTSGLPGAGSALSARPAKHAPVAQSPRHTVLVEPLEQQLRVAPADACEVAKAGKGDLSG